jgi:hypothetical protein
MTNVCIARRLLYACVRSVYDSNVAAKEVAKPQLSRKVSVSVLYPAQPPWYGPELTRQFIAAGVVA